MFCGEDVNLRDLTVTFFAAQVKQFYNILLCTTVLSVSHSAVISAVTQTNCMGDRSLLSHNNKVYKVSSQPTLTPPCCTVIPLCSCSLVIPTKTLQAREIHLFSIQKLESFSFSSENLPLQGASVFLDKVNLGCWKFEGTQTKIDEHLVKWKLQGATPAI